MSTKIRRGKAKEEVLDFLNPFSNLFFKPTISKLLERKKSGEPKETQVDPWTSKVRVSFHYLLIKRYFYHSPYGLPNLNDSAVPNGVWNHRNRRYSYLEDKGMYSYRKTSNFDLWNGLKRRSKVNKERSRGREVCVAFSHTASVLQRPDASDGVHGCTKCHPHDRLRHCNRNRRTRDYINYYLIIIKCGKLQINYCHLFSTDIMAEIMEIQAGIGASAGDGGNGEDPERSLPKPLPADAMDGETAEDSGKLFTCTDCDSSKDESTNTNYMFGRFVDVTINAVETSKDGAKTPVSASKKRRLQRRRQLVKRRLGLLSISDGGKAPAEVPSVKRTLNSEGAGSSGWEGPSPNLPNPKRSRPTGTTPNGPTAMGKPSFAGAAAQPLRLFSLMRTPLVGTGREEFQELRAALTREVLRCRSRSIRIVDTTYCGGVVTTSCADRETQVWAKGILDSEARWTTWAEGGQPPEEFDTLGMTRRRVIRLWLDASIGPLTRQFLLEIISRQNDVDTSGWSITALQEIQGEYLVVIRMSDADLAALRRLGLQLFVGIARVRCRVEGEDRGGRRGGRGGRGGPQGGKPEGGASAAASTSK